MIESDPFDIRKGRQSIESDPFDTFDILANIPGKVPSLVFCFGGVGQFRQEAAAIIRKGYPGFVMEKEGGLA